jgi:hypothetical protein
MKRPKIEDYKNKYTTFNTMNDYSKAQDDYLDYLEAQKQALNMHVVIVPKGTCCLNPNIKGMVNDMHESWSECTNCKKETV